MKSPVALMTTAAPWRVADVARYLGYSERYTYQLARDGVLPGKKVRGRWFFDPKKIRDYAGVGC